MVLISQVIRVITDFFTNAILPPSEYETEDDALEACQKSKTCSGVTYIEEHHIWRIIGEGKSKGPRNGKDTKPHKVTLRTSEVMASHSTYWTVYSDRKLGREYRTYNSLEVALRHCAREKNCNGVTAQVTFSVVMKLCVPDS